MTEQHRAKPEVWAAVERWSKNDMDSCNCTLELRSRVEALEAAQRVIPSPSSNRTHLGLTQDAPAYSDSLVERVAGSLTTGLHSDARAAILAVVEALESAQRVIASPSSNRTHLGLTQDAPESSDSLMEEVVDAITDASAAYGTADEPARAAILATANWLDQQELHDAAKRLRMEVG